jgi:hypothetical protein
VVIPSSKFIDGKICNQHYFELHDNFLKERLQLTQIPLSRSHLQVLVNLMPTRLHLVLGMHIRLLFKVLFDCDQNS